MGKTFLTREEVAGLLRIGERTLATYGSMHGVYRADRAGLYHAEHVEILVKVWGKFITCEEGFALWQQRKLEMRKCLRSVSKDAKTQRQRRSKAG